MRTLCLFLATASLSCAGSHADGPSATAAADVAAAPTSEPAGPATSQATAAPTGAASADAGESSNYWKIGSGDAHGLDVKNDLGQAIRVESLAWKQFERKVGGLAHKDLADANVSLASLTADGATAEDVACKLAEWTSPPDDPLTMTTVLISLAITDAVPVIALLKNKSALASCGSGKGLRVRFNVRGSKLVAAEVLGGDAKATSCVKTALTTAVLAGTGSCVATLLP